MKKLLLLFVFTILPLLASADAVEIDGIWYSLVNNSKVKIAGVTKSPNLSSYYSGTIEIPEKVTYDGIDYDVTSIGYNAFGFCMGLTSITIPNSIESIGSQAFINCSGLSSITIPNSVNSIGSDAFKNCEELTSVHIMDLKTWCNTKFDGYYSNPLSYAHKLFLNGVELKDLVIPNSMTSIGNYAFSNCSSLTSITIPNSVTSIGDYAFYGCSSLPSVTIPNSVASIGKLAFSGCSSLPSVTIPNSVVSIGELAFSGCIGLTSINVEADNTKYDSRDKCNAIVETETNTLIAGCQNTIIPNSVTSIGDDAFSGCSSLTSITIPNSVTSIGWCAFSSCSGLTSITIPNSVTIIEAYTFADCSKLSSVTIGSGVTRIGGNSNGRVAGSSFENCPELTDVTCLAENVPYTYLSTFNGSYIEYATLHVPVTAVETYKSTSPWNQFKEIVSMSVTKYTLTYMVDGEVYKTYELAEGTTITPEPAPTKEGYVFSGWSTIPATMPAEDLTITGSFQLITDEDVITLKDTGKGTWCSIYDLDFTDVEGIKAYTATGYDDVDKTIWLTRVFKVPAGTGIMVKGDPGEHKIPHATVKAVYASFFKGVTGSAVTINETDGDNTNYYMAGGQFKKVNGSTTISPNRAYLQLPTLVFAGTRSIDVIYEDEIDDKTGIHSAAITSDQEPGIYYNLQGQRVDNPKKGIYIKNGKKVVIK